MKTKPYCQNCIFWENNKPFLNFSKEKGVCTGNDQQYNCYLLKKDKHLFDQNVKPEVFESNILQRSYLLIADSNFGCNNFKDSDIP